MNPFTSETFYSSRNLHDYKTDSELHLEIERATSSKRYVVALLICLGSVNMFFMRSNMTIAVVDMMSNKTVTIGNETRIIGPEFSWDSKTRGIVLSLFYYGYLTAPVAGYVASKFGGVRSYGYGMLITAILTLMTPFNLHLNFYWFAFCRVAEGVSEAVSYTSMMDIASKWARPEERSKFVAFGFTGVYIGTTLGFPMCGYLAHKYSWPAIFYGTGALGLFWTLLWFLMVPVEPDEDEEASYSHLSRSSFQIFKQDYPWKQILTCKSLWALSVIRMSYAAGYSIVSLLLPLYLIDITSENTHNIGLLTAIPNFISIFMVPLSGWLIDYLVNSHILTTTQVHKIYVCTSLSLAGVILISITFISKLFLTITSLVFFKILLTFSFVVGQIMPVCVAPPFSSVFSGIASLLYTITMIVSPIFIGFVVTDRTIAQWNICFVSTATVMIIGAVVFLVYASSEIQPWAILQNHVDDEDADIELKNL